MRRAFFRKNDIILLAALLIVGIAASFVIARPKKSAGDNASVLVMIAGREKARYPLNEDADYTIHADGRIEDGLGSEGDYNIIRIENNKVDMIESDCRSQICVHHKPISKQGETIICLPHRVVISIESGQGGGYDTIAQ